MENLLIGDLCVIKNEKNLLTTSFAVKKNKLGKWVRKSIRFYDPSTFGLIIDFCYRPTIEENHMKADKYYILLIDDELIEFNHKNCCSYFDE